jgi:nitroreductase
MTPVPDKTVLEALHWRYATQKFDREKKIPDGTWATLEQALILAPSSYNLQPWKFIIVTDQEVKDRLSGASRGQTKASECSHFVVFAVRKDLDPDFLERYVGRTAEVRGTPRESHQGLHTAVTSFVERLGRAGTLEVWKMKQPYIALGQFMTVAALLGVDTCPMEGIEGPKFDAILGLPALGYNALCACAAGYRAADDKYATHRKVRFPSAEVIHNL